MSHKLALPLVYYKISKFILTHQHITKKLVALHVFLSAGRFAWFWHVLKFYPESYRDAIVPVNSINGLSEPTLTLIVKVY